MWFLYLLVPMMLASKGHPTGRTSASGKEEEQFGEDGDEGDEEGPFAPVFLAGA